MIAELTILVVRENFFMSIAIPGVIGAIVLLMIGNALLKNFGYYLW